MQWGRIQNASGGMGLRKKNRGSLVFERKEDGTCANSVCLGLNACNQEDEEIPSDSFKLVPQLMGARA